MFRKVQLIAYLLMIFLVGACSNEAASTRSSSDKASAAGQPPENAKRTLDHHKTHRGKPGADVRLRENLVHRLEPGVDSEVVLGLTAAYGEGTMMVTVGTSDGLHILGGASHYTFPLSRAGDYSMPLRLMAAEPGRYYVHIQVSVDHQGRQMIRVLSAIVQVGEESGPEKARQKAGNPDDIVPLPARETIIQQ